ncbi:carbohydrate esterase family 6 protein, partial [Piromyces sp. E2]
MKIKNTIHYFATIATLFLKTYAQPDPNFHIYLAFGQSNMEGQGSVSNTSKEYKTANSRFLHLQSADCKGHSKGNWKVAVPPLAHVDAGYGLVDAFGRKLIRKLPEEIKVGATVVAVSGCNIHAFDKTNYDYYVNEITKENYFQKRMGYYGRYPYGRLIEMGKEAKKVGVIKGILLHQGENNSGEKEWPNYVKNIYENILKDLNLNGDEVPLLVGEVIHSEMGGSAGKHNEIINKIPKYIPNSYVISSKGLSPRRCYESNKEKDCVHFSDEGYIILGERYADKMLEILSK